VRCDMCGKETQLFSTEIEGTILNVCVDCSKFGTILQKVKERTEVMPESKKEFSEETIEIVIEDYADKIKKKRERLGLNQEELAKKIGIKESLFHHIESGNFTPSIDVARKIERFLNIKLIKEYTEIRTNISKSKSDEFTIGDIIKIKKK